MWFIPLLFSVALPAQGDMKVALDHAVYPAGDSGAALEVSYEIPNTSLTFLREGDGFIARYQIAVQASDKRRNVIAGDMWQKAVRLAEYGPSVVRESVQTGTVSLALPGTAHDARVEVSDLASDRTALALFRIERPTGGMVVRLYKGGAQDSLHGRRATKYRLGDTLVAVAVAVSDEDRIDSCRFLLKREGRVVAGATTPAVMSDAEGRLKSQARFDYAIGESSSVARVGGGEYVLDVTGLGAGRRLTGSIGFRLEVPFFLDDSAYLRKVAQLVFIASPEEMRHLKAVPRSEREQAWREFWKKKDRSPTTERNEREEEYFERIEYAREHFGHGDRGFLSDRARVYVLCGQPDQIESRPFEIDSPAYETWHYYELNKRFIFVDRFGTGEYILQNREALAE